jgi:hypothetical protein
MVDAHQLERQDVFRLHNQDAANPDAIFVQAPDESCLLDSHIDRASKGHIKDPPICEAAQSFDENMEHLVGKSFQHHHPHQLLTVRESRGR